MKITDTINLALKGFAMGIAEVIPGVSGGTIAFITGIYEELIHTIKGINMNLIKTLFQADLKQFWRDLNGVFLLRLFSGMFLGLIVGVLLITKLLESHPETLWGFFFGLVLASCFYVGKQIKSSNFVSAVFVLLGAVFAVIVCSCTPAEGSDSWLAVYFSAVIAISALMLPGVSGSFILLILGMYSVIIPHVKELMVSPNIKSLEVVAVFGLGAITGLMLFSRVLSYAFRHFKNRTLAVLTGLMLGSLYKIWPWRNPEIVINKENGDMITIQVIDEYSSLNMDHFKILSENNVLPASYFSEADVPIVILAFLLGLFSILIVERVAKTKIS